MNYAVFLRGINVGGIRVGMVDLTQCLSIAGLDEVKTYLQSGNVTCTSELDKTALQEHVEAALTFRFQYSARVVVHTLHEVKSIIEGFPWADTPPTSHRYAILSSDRENLEEMAAGVSELPSEEQRFLLGKLCAYWEVPKGLTLGTEISKFIGKKKFSQTTTMRNLNTLEKMV